MTGKEFAPDLVKGHRLVFFSQLNDSLKQIGTWRLTIPCKGGAHCVHKRDIKKSVNLTSGLVMRNILGNSSKNFTEQKEVRTYTAVNLITKLLPKQDGYMLHRIQSKAVDSRFLQPPQRHVNQILTHLRILMRKVRKSM